MKEPYGMTWGMLLLAAACTSSGSDGGTGLGGAAASKGGAAALSGTGGAGGSSESQLGSLDHCPCRGDLTCVSLELSVQGTGQQAWLSDPLADGRGTLVVIVRDERGMALRAALSDVDALAAPLSLELGCLAAGNWTLALFLDDDGDESARALWSSDGSDTCSGGTSLIAAPFVVPAEGTITVAQSLGPTCNREVD